MNDGRGGDDEFLAPVIPLFGERDEDVGSPSDRHPARRSPRLRAVVTDHVPDARDEQPHPRSPQHDETLLRGNARDRDGGEDAGDTASRRARLQRLPSFSSVDGAEEESSEEEFSRASDVLVRRLRNKQFSVSEARDLLRGLEVSPETVENVLDDFIDRRYLDDRTLAENVARTASERKGQGRMMVRRTLTQRGIPRDVIDDVLADHEDDDAERALEFARDRARTLVRLEHEVALRRLVGQLARRGYASGVAMNAARRALEEEQGKRFRPGTTSSVVFRDSDDDAE